MDLRTAVLSLTGAGAVVNARRPLDEWSRAQDEVTALLDRLDHGATAPLGTGRATSSAA
jgi:hypothetical protein